MSEWRTANVSQRGRDEGGINRQRMGCDVREGGGDGERETKRGEIEGCVPSSPLVVGVVGEQLLGGKWSGRTREDAGGRGRGWIEVEMGLSIEARETDTDSLTQARRESERESESSRRRQQTQETASERETGSAVRSQQPATRSPSTSPAAAPCHLEPMVQASSNFPSITTSATTTTYQATLPNNRRSYPLPQWTTGGVALHCSTLYCAS